MVPIFARASPEKVILEFCYYLNPLTAENSLETPTYFLTYLALLIQWNQLSRKNLFEN